MKMLDEPYMTLNELIVYLEKITLPMTHEAVKTDCIHYLKELRYAKTTLEAEKERYQEAVKNCELAENRYKQMQKAAGDALWQISSEDNPPLDWSELEQMEGKPVWVEGDHGCIWGQKAWSLIRLDPENDDIVICISTDGGVHYEYAIGKEDYGTDWQAYRKERE